MLEMTEILKWKSTETLPPSRTECLIVLNGLVYCAMYVENDSKIAPARQRFEFEDQPSVPADSVQYWCEMPKGPQHE